MRKQLEVLSISEQTTISEALLRLVASYDNFPKTISAQNILWQYLDVSECIGIYTMAGAVYLKKYITGSFQAQFPFCIRYVCKPTANKTRLLKQNILDQLGEWLESAELPSLTDNREIESIGRTGTTFLTGSDSAGNEIYQCNFNLKYVKKESEE